MQFLARVFGCYEIYKNKKFLSAAMIIKPSFDLARFCAKRFRPWLRLSVSPPVFFEISIVVNPEESSYCQGRRGIFESGDYSTGWQVWSVWVSSNYGPFKTERFSGQSQAG
jgi:hypothetical protein